jgi:hypothetical protein
MEELSNLEIAGTSTHTVTMVKTAGTNPKIHLN